MKKCKARMHEKILEPIGKRDCPKKGLDTIICGSKNTLPLGVVDFFQKEKYVKKTEKAGKSAAC